VSSGPPPYFARQTLASLSNRPRIHTLRTCEDNLILSERGRERSARTTKIHRTAAESLDIVSHLLMSAPVEATTQLSHDDMVAAGYLEPVYIQDEHVEEWMRKLREARIHDLDGFRLTAGIDIEKIPKTHRNQIKVTHLGPPHMHRSIMTQNIRGICPKCWLTAGMCMCDLIPPVALPSHIHLHFLVHYEEYLRASNTVKLIERGVQLANEVFFEEKDPQVIRSEAVVWPGPRGGPVAGDGTEPAMENVPFVPAPTVDFRKELLREVGTDEVVQSAQDLLRDANGTVDMLIYGVDAHHTRLINVFTEIEETKAHALVLFPSGDSKLIDDLLPELQGELRRSESDATMVAPTEDASTGSRPQIEAKEEKKGGLLPIHIFVLDGTWRQANHMHNRFLDPLCRQLVNEGKLSRLPQYVKIDPQDILPDSKSLFEPLRSQTQADRCCTLEATVALLRKLGVSQSLTIEPLFYALKCLVDSLQTQNGFHPDYGTLSRKRLQRMRGARADRPRGFREASRNAACERSHKYMRLASSAAAVAIAAMSGAATNQEEGCTIDQSEKCASSE